MTLFHVPATLSGFPTALGLPTRATVSFDGSDLAWSLFVTGRASGDEAVHGHQSLWEFLHRVTLIPAYIRVAAGALTRSPLAMGLDRSEKVNLSYSLGQAMAGIFASRVLGVTRLMHVDRYAAHHRIVFATGKKRPDLFGQASSGWVVVEAKGRSNLAEPQLVRTLRNQKSMVASITGAAPWVAAGVVAEFDPKSGQMRLLAVDPPESIEAQDWDVDPDRYAAAYYEPFAVAISAGAESRAEANDRLRVADLGAVGVRIGMLRQILDVLAEARERRYEGLAAEVDEILAETASESTRPDGSWFATTWDAALTASGGGARDE